MASSSSTPSSSRSTIVKLEHDTSSPLPPAQAAPSAGTTVVRGRGREASGVVKKKSQRTPTPSPPPPTTYRDIPLLSTSAETPWVYHLARFVHHQRMDPTDESTFVPPLKLNRKHPPKVKQPNPKPGDPVVDRHGRPIKLPGGESLLWPRTGEDLTEHHKLIDRMKPQEKQASSQYDASLVAPSGAPVNRSGSRPLFQKRVRQIHKASATARRIHNDETLPWVLEDFETGHGWESSRTPRKDSLAALAKHFDEGGSGLADGSGGDGDAGADGVKAEQAGPERPDGEGQKEPNNHENKIIQHAPWVGKLEGSDQSLSSSETSSAQVLFVFDERNQGGFRVIPVRKTYRFMQRSRFANELGDEEREKEYARLQRSRDVTSDKFAGRVTAARGPLGSGSGASSAGSSGRLANGTRGGLAMPGSFGRTLSGGVKKEEGLDDDWAQMRGLSLNTTSSRSRGLISVSGGSSSRRGGGMDDEDGGFHRRDNDEGATYDELDYQEDFADDEERMGGEAELVEDTEAREMEDRLKREMAKAGVGGDDDDAGAGDDGDDTDLFGDDHLRRGRPREDDQLTGTGRQMKKIMKALARREGGQEEYESDDDINPYASEDEEDDDEPAIANPEEAMRRAKEEKEREEKEAARLAGTLPGTPVSTGPGAASTQKPSTQSDRASRGVTPVPSTSGKTTNSGAVTPSKRAAQQQQAHKGRASHGGQSSSGHHRVGSGHADVAKRAAGSRGGSPAQSRSPSPGPQGGHHVPRQSSPLAEQDAHSSTAVGAGIKRPASPIRDASMGTSGSGSANASSGGRVPSDAKRLRTDSATSSANSRVSSPTSSAGNAVSSLEAELISLVRSSQVSTIGEVIARFRKRLQQKPEIKQEMMGAFKRVLTGGVKGETLRVKEGF
ncbi:unnamed protein product [Parajaminaea phylloscopi]